MDEPELADEISRKMFVFEDIIQLDDKSIQRVLRDVDNNDLAIAMKSCNQEVQDTIFQKPFKTSWFNDKRKIWNLWDLYVLRDVEEAQQKIVAVIRKLADSSEIIIACGGGDEIVV